jgi:hypothetical protein
VAKPPIEKIFSLEVYIEKSKIARAKLFTPMTISMF